MIWMISNSMEDNDNENEGSLVKVVKIMRGDTLECNLDLTNALC